MILQEKNSLSFQWHLINTLQVINSVSYLQDQTGFHFHQYENNQLSVVLFLDSETLYYPSYGWSEKRDSHGYTKVHLLIQIQYLL